MYEYDLFAVINHEGQIDNGHYTNYARFQDEVSLGEVIIHDGSAYAHRFASGIVSTMTSKSHRFFFK
jgi:ubiquitin C-terminal hydrolase